MFTPVQRELKFNQTIYTSLPWFLEYNEGTFPPKEELQHNNAVKEREERALRMSQSVRLSDNSKMSGALEGVAKPQDTASSIQEANPNVPVDTTQVRNHNQDILVVLVHHQIQRVLCWFVA